MKVLVIGGASGLGQALSELALSREDVTILDHDASGLAPYASRARTAVCEALCSAGQPAKQAREAGCNRCAGIATAPRRPFRVGPQCALCRHFRTPLSGPRRATDAPRDL